MNAAESYIKAIEINENDPIKWLLLLCQLCRHNSKELPEIWERAYRSTSLHFLNLMGKFIAVASDHLSEEANFQYPCIRIEQELKGLIEFAAFLFEKSDCNNFCCIVCPILEAYHGQSQTHKSSQRPTSLSMLDIVSSDDNEANSDRRRWLGNDQHVCWQFCRAICNCCRLEDVFTASAIREMLTKVAICTEKLKAEVESVANGNGNRNGVLGELVDEGFRIAALFEGIYVPHTTRERERRAAVVGKTIVEDEGISAMEVTDSSVDIDVARPVSEPASRSRFLPTEGHEKEEVLPDSLPAEVHAAIRMLLKNSKDISAANYLVRTIMMSPVLSLDGLSSFDLAVSLKQLADREQSVFTHLCAAHEQVSERKFYHGIESYLTAFNLDKQQPITSLCLGSFLMLFAAQPTVKERNETFAKGLAFLSHYMHLRIRGEDSTSTKSTQETLDEIMSRQGECELQPDVLGELGRVQEVFYNVGRAFHSVHLNHLAHYMYERALQLAESYPQLNESKLSLTREVAFNLCLIYRKSGADELALNVIRNHLSYD